MTSDSAAYRLSLDAYGLETSRTYLDEAGKPTMSKFGYITGDSVRNDRGDEVKWTVKSATGQVTQLQSSSHAIVRTRRDDRGNALEDSYFDADDRPALSPDGVHSVKMSYDERDNQVMVSYFDLDNKATTSLHFFAGWRVEFDLDRMISKTYLGLTGEPVDMGWGFAMTRTDYDAMGVSSPVKYFDAMNREVNPPRLCGTLREHQAPEVLERLYPLAKCAASALPPSLVAVLELDMYGRISSSAFLGLTSKTLRSCLEAKLEGVTLPEPEKKAPDRYCGKVNLQISFPHKAIRLLIPTEPELAHIERAPHDGDQTALGWHPRTSR